MINKIKALWSILIVVVVFMNMPAIEVKAEAVSDEWSIKTTIENPKAVSAVSELNGKIYMFGGSSGSNPYKDVQIYDPKNNIWASGINMPTARAAATSVVYGNDIYVIGGYTGNAFNWTGGSSVNNVEVYNTQTDTWSVKKAMPQALGSLTSVLYKGKIYVFGGMTTNTLSVATVQVYDPASDSWSTKKPMPNTIHGSSAVLHKDKIYLVAGRHIDNSSNVSLNTFLEYDPDSDNWSTKPNLLTARGGAQAVIYSNKIFAIAGKTEAGGRSYELSTVESFDFGQNKWSPEASLKQARSGAGAITLGGQIYVIGGSQSTLSNSPVNTIEIFGKIDSSTPTPEPTDPSQPTGDRAILVVTMTTGLEKEFDLSMQEVNDFIAWYEAKQAGSGSASYAINKHDNNKGPFSSRKDYMLYDRILTFEVSEYSK
ncbi:kelch repeat-containing protein [Paenibacillus polymyxa]|uniref:Kelch repeat-containing protein n=1 Tax=Paenibacillus TaxID=44249 RepID=UPI00278CFDAC|nr:kelch repeat-containing protein [Paenibacillus polymyxa]MDQ0046040.1 N-acetylneuraminic acid mutarotase [Paenibacillus polymyxa]